jgi:predicted dehydrogenase
MPSIAIIGCGLIGETHAECLAQLGSPPTAFFDLDYARAETLAKKYQGKAYRTYEEIVSDNSIDAVYICTYHDTHASYTVQAANAGKHIFLEKPMAITQPDCEAIARAVQENNVLCMTGFKLHYASLARKAFELMPKPTVLVANVFDARWPDTIWANDPKRGGGNVLSQGCHAVELLMYFTRSAPKSVHAVGGNLHHTAIDITDSIATSMEFESGAIASLTVADSGAMPHNGKFLIRMSDGERSIELYDRLTRMSFYDGKNLQEFSAEEDGFLNENREFLAALQERRAPETNERTGFAVQRVLFAAIESTKSRLPQFLSN